MPATYEPIATTTLSSTATTIEFTSIPSTYTDLVIVFVGTSANSSYFTFRFNSVSTSSYGQLMITGDGSGVGNNKYQNQTELQSPSLAMTSTPQFFKLDIFNYAGNTRKSVLYTCSADNNGSGLVGMLLGIFDSTSAITSIQLNASYASPNSFSSGTTATLYGILKA